VKKTKKIIPQNIRAVDLFCGVGGLTHGLVKGGINVVAGVDVDQTCRHPYEANNSAEFILRDVSALSAKDVRGFFDPGSVSLLAGCAPCQPFSTYSRSGRNSQYESQWPLALEFSRLVNQVKPDLVTMENVPQLADHVVFEQFVDSLKGYSKWWAVVECGSIGVPQTRKRLVFLASRLGEKSLGLQYPGGTTVTVRETIFGLPKIGAGESDRNDPLHAASALSPLNLRRIRASKPGGTWRDWPTALQADCHKKISGATYPSVYGRMSWEKPAPTMTTQCFGYGNGRFGHPEQDRAISLREAAMLQTFPEDYDFLAPGEKVRFNRLGRLIGNAVPVRLGEVIAQSLFRHLKEYA
jgi:DNA (cytosine-5)-methyltransferase 1